MRDSRPRLYRFGAAIDAAGIDLRPAAMLVRDGQLEAIDRPEAIGTTDVDVLEAPNHVVLPALVNAHTHLDLSHVGPQAYDGEFVEWIDMVRAARCETDESLQRSVRRGIDLSLAGGVVAVGDISGAGSLVPVDVLQRSRLIGASYVEIFGIGARSEAAIERMRRLRDGRLSDVGGVRVGLQPHAPYSCSTAVYEAASAFGCPLASHLAETRDEIAFTRDAAGPLADLLRRFGLWDASIEATGQHPVDLLASTLARGHWNLAHLNYAEPSHMEVLASSSVTVTYCPRASAYFGHPTDGQPAHQYREMAAAGVRVALGTDSLIGLDRDDRMTTLDEMRFLSARDGTDPVQLLSMATINGAEAVGIESKLVTLTPGCAGVLALEFDPADPRPALTQVMETDECPLWIIGRDV